MVWGVRCIQARFQWGMHYVHTSSRHSTQVCLVLICCIQGCLEKHIFLTWYLQFAVLCNEKLSLNLNVHFSLPWQPTCTCLGRRVPEGPWTAAQRGETLDKSSIYPWWALHGSLTAGNKDTVCERITKEMPSQPVVPGQEHTAVGHTAPRCWRCSAAARCYTQRLAEHPLTERNLSYSQPRGSSNDLYQVV